ncbi:hypothetical protein GH714_009164 [Hevea brasiliensis]|uniref:Chromo domain-containing protein n=1 Tax=Hevea brasiliensis TaxID=3981 RepID=A0A6A6LWX6_HEVBR|nr:hypothetical protein GH714_009164 [Hevea brasiliensis]
MDQRVEQLEQTVQSLSGGQEGIAKRLEELFSQLNVRMDRLTSQSSQGKGIDSDTAIPESRIRPNSSRATSSYTPKMVKLDFPRFDEKEDATSWVCRAEQFFQFHRTPDEDRVEIASFHMIGDAQLWYQVLRRENPSITWDEFKEGFYSRYGANQLTDFFGELAKLQQQGTVQSYQVQFEKLLAKVGDLSQARQVSCFVSGLAPAIRTDVQANRPKSLSEAIALARLFEARNSATGKGFSATRTTHQAPRQSPTNSPQPATGNIKRLTWDELNERKRLGLCFKCNEKFGPGHRCKKLFSIQAVLEDNDDDADMEIEEHDPTEEIPAISLHAIAGFEGPETMRLTGTVEKLKGIILVDSGNTHNFVSESFAKRAGIEPTNAKKLKVQVASGEELISPGTQWLRTLGPIIWDFSKLLMTFFQNGKHVIFQGSQIPENQIVSAEHMELVKLLKRGFLLQITGSTQSCSQVPELHPEIQGTAKVAAVEQELVDRDAVIQELKEKIQRAQNRMKQVYDLKHQERAFAQQLPFLDDGGELIPQPEAILDSRTKRRKREVLIQWHNLSPTEATWEELTHIRIGSRSKKQFVPELFRKDDDEMLREDDDPIFNMSCMLQFLHHDLILLENQIPWLVLEKLFNMTKEPGSKSLTQLALKFFHNIFSFTPPPIVQPFHEQKHILDLLRNWLVLSSGKAEDGKLGWQPIPSATNLVDAGIKFRMGEAKSILDIKFTDGVLEIPSLLIQETTEVIIRNLISYEQCCPKCSTRITSYAILLDNLINTAKDMDILTDNGIIDNWLNPEDATQFFNKLYHDAYVKKYYYLDLCEKVNEYCHRRWPRWRAMFMRNYFGTPWAIASQIVAATFLILTVLQTLFTIIK